MTAAAVKERDHDRRGARSMHRWNKWPDRERRIVDLHKIDRRTSLGRVLAQFKKDLETRVIEKRGRPLDAVDQGFIVDACLLRADISRMEKSLFETGNPGVPQNAFVATMNAFRKTLGMLGLGETAEVERHKVETSSRAVEARLFREFSR